MQVANCWMVLNRDGTNVYRKLVTPAEAQLLWAMFKSAVGACPITELEVLRDADKEPVHAAVIVKRDEDNPGDLSKAKMRLRKDSEELIRLSHKYQDAKLEKFFPGLNPKLPQTFEEIGLEEGQTFHAPSKNTGKEQATRRGAASDEDFVFMSLPDGVSDVKELVDV